SMEEGNKYLRRFKEDYNRRFGRKPQSKENAHRELLGHMKLDKILCAKEERKISKSLEVHYKHKTYRLKARGNSRKLWGKIVEIREYEGRVVIDYQGEECEYIIFEDQPYVGSVKDRKQLDAFLDKKKHLTIIQKLRKGRAVNF